MRPDSTAARLLEQARRQPSRSAYNVRGADGTWKSTNYGTFAEEVRTAARALVSLGLEPGERTCLLGYNKPEWVIFDIATMMAGGVPAGIYTTCSPEEVQYIIDHAEARVVLLEDEGQWEKVKAERERLPNLKHVVMMKGVSIDDPMVLTWEDFIAKAEDTDDAVIDARLDGLKPDDTATFIYTSGTTGPPKAVMLTNDNLTHTANVAVDMVTADHNDRMVSYLPLSHIAEQMFTIHGPCTAGYAIYYAESLDTLLRDMQEMKPTILFGVPRVWEKMHAGLTAKIGQATGIKAKLVNWAMGVGRKVTALRNAGSEPSGFLALQYAFASKRIFGPVKEALGLNEARFGISGAAPIAAEVLEFFSGLDITIYEVYGQSEGTGPTSFNQPGRTKFGTVGPAIPGTEIRIAEDGEICVRGRNIFKGYFKNEAATNDTLVDGWLLSGDLGKVDSEGFLSITGRKKEIIITAGGKNIAPKNIEAALKNLPLVSQAVVIGDRRKFLSALITLDPEAAEAFASENGLNGDIHASDAVQKVLQQGIDDEVNPLFARVEWVRKFAVLPRDLSVEDGELTPTLKVKRRVVDEHFADVIEGMYAEG